MEVLLQKDVDNLGRMGDVVQVKDGYARNFLLPKRIAVAVSPENLRQIEKLREARRQRELEEAERVRQQAKLLGGYLCFISARATDKGHLFGSVGPQQIADHLVANGFEGVRATNVELIRPIEEVGDYEVSIMLHPEVRTSITVRVVSEEDQAQI